MTITNVFDAIRDGTYEEFQKYYNGDIDAVHERLGLNLLQFALVNGNGIEEKKKIIKFLLQEGIDINFEDLKSKRNALHIFYSSVLRPEPKYLLEITKTLVEHGINLNATDRYGAIPLKYAITIIKLETKDIVETYEYLIQHGTDFRIKDKFGKSCIDYAKEYSWRNEVLGIMEDADEDK